MTRMKGSAGDEMILGHAGRDLLRGNSANTASTVAAAPTGYWHQVLSQSALEPAQLFGLRDVRPRVREQAPMPPAGEGIGQF
jgi:hypothetical protein